MFDENVNKIKIKDIKIKMFPNPTAQKVIHNNINIYIGTRKSKI